MMNGRDESRHRLCFSGYQQAQVKSHPSKSRIMSPRSENQNEMPNARDGRRRELRELLVSAADAARQTRLNSLSATLSRAVPQAVRERVSVFLAAAR
jgi:hypothetical protein